MRTAMSAALLAAIVSLPHTSSAQVFRNETPPPAVDAATASWQLSGEPVFYAGSFYYPAGATVFFDGKVMVRTGIFRGVPLYADVTLEPYSIVYVPIGGALLQPYERRREGEIVGTVGSRTPSFPIGRDVELSASSEGIGLLTPPVGMTDPEVQARIDAAQPTDRGSRVAPTRVQRAQARDEVFEPAGVMMISPPNRQERADARVLSNASLPPASQDTGVWIDYDNARWVSAGRAVDYDPARFDRIGEHRGYPVYRERGRPSNRIFVTIVRNGPLAPFDRR